jgi:hypothetical protein
MEEGSFLTKMEIGYEFRDLHHVFVLVWKNVDLK